MKDFEKQISEKKGQIFDNLGIIFAFNQSQFDEKKKVGVVYSSLGSGLICPKENVNEFIRSMKELTKQRVELDLQHNSRDKIILRELCNTEAFYTGEIDDTVEALKDYPFSVDEILKVYRTEQSNQSTW